jgi:hypothetical protein
MADWLSNGLLEVARASSWKLVPGFAGVELHLSIVRKSLMELDPDG